MNDFFYRLPEIYDGLTEVLSLGAWKKWQKKALEDVVGPKVLEIGFGPGKLLVKMAQLGFTVTGVDNSGYMLRLAQRRVEQKGVKVKLLKASVYNLPFADNIFDSVVCTFAISGFNDLEKAFGEMKRVVKKQGKIIIVDGGYPMDDNLLGRIILRAISGPHSIYRNEMLYLGRVGLQASRADFGPFHIVHKIVAVK